MKSRIEQLKEYLENDPNDSFSNYALALEYMKLKEDKSGIQLLEKILKDDEQYLAAYYQLGKMYEKMDRVDDAKDIYRKGITVAATQKNRRTLNELRSAFDTLNEDE